MPDPNAIVSTTVRLVGEDDKQPLGELVVELQGERRVRLDPENPRSAGFARVLHGLSSQRLPVYVEVDPGNDTVARVLIPVVGRVVALAPVAGGLGVELDTSHAVRLVRSGDETPPGMRPSCAGRSSTGGRCSSYPTRQARSSTCASSPPTWKAAYPLSHRTPGLSRDHGRGDCSGGGGCGSGGGCGGRSGGFAARRPRGPRRCSTPWRPRPVSRSPSRRRASRSSTPTTAAGRGLTRCAGS